MPSRSAALCLLLLLLAPLLSARADIITLTATDNGRQTQLNIGDELVVRLPTRSSRYGWRLTQNYPGQLTLTSSHILPGLASGVPGAVATHEMHFQAVGTGGVDLAFVSAVVGGGYSPAGDFFRTFVTIDKPGVAKNVNITEYGNRSRVTVNQGDQLQIVLAATAGSTFRWEAMPLANEIVQLVEQPEKPARKPRKKPKPGSSEDVTFRYQALNPGNTTIRFLYRDTAHPDAPPQRDFELQVEVPQPPR
jgi:predicted secreted protein